MDDVVREFLVESLEGLDQLDRDLVALEQTPGDHQLVARIFRCVHTVKGTCGFLGFSKLEALSHLGESLLSLLRDGVRTLTPPRVNALFQLVDALREILGRIEHTGAEGDEDYAALAEMLAAQQGGDPKNVGEIFLEPGLVTPADVWHAAARQARGNGLRIGEILVEQAHTSPGAIVEALEIQQDARANPAYPVRAVSERSVRVDVGLLDRLTHLVGELALVHDQIVRHIPDAGPDRGFLATCRHLEQITAALQAGVIEARIQSIGTSWANYPRLVRELAVTLRKRVRIEMVGESIELDRTTIAAIKDPITHIIRNAVDHGIEAPGVRMAAGKPAEGRIHLGAFRDGDRVRIEVVDDGAGIDAERIKAKALERGLASADQASRMTEGEALRLLFAPGFSLAEAVSTMSGRGVGMDIVRTNIEAIGGAVGILSVKGKGTTLEIRVPLTAASRSGLGIIRRAADVGGGDDLPRGVVARRDEEGTLCER